MGRLENNIHGTQRLYNAIWDGFGNGFFIDPFGFGPLFLSPSMQIVQCSHFLTNASTCGVFAIISDLRSNTPTPI